MRIKRWKAFLESNVQKMVKLDSVGSMLNTKTGTIHGCYTDGTWEEEGVDYDEVDQSFWDEMSPEDKETVQDAMISSKDVFGDRVNLDAIKYLEELCLSEELIDENPVLIRVMTKNPENLMKGYIYANKAYLPTIYLRRADGSMGEGEWSKSFSDEMDRHNYGDVYYCISFENQNLLLNADIQLKIPKDVAQSLQDRFDDAFPGLGLFVF
jgi:hypothetical protein